MYLTRIDAYGGIDLQPLQGAGYTVGKIVCVSLTSAGSILITIDDTPILLEAIVEAPKQHALTPGQRDKET